MGLGVDEQDGSAGPAGSRVRRRVRRSVAIGLVVAVWVGGVVVAGAAAGSPASATGTSSGTVAASSVRAAGTAGATVAASSARAAATAGTSTAPRLAVTKVTAHSTVTSTRTRVTTALTVKNTSSVRKPALDAWLYLAAGSGKYTLGRVAVRSLAPGASTTVRSTRTAPSRAPAGKYTVLACTGAYTATGCRSSIATVPTARTPRARPETGLMLDVARAYYPVPLLEQYVDLLADHGGRFLHLHLTDDQNVGIESDVLGQTLADADLHDGVWTSRVTGRPFLSVAQARTVADHANQRGIAIVPEVDTPGHMAAAFALLEARHGAQWVDRIRAGESELDTTAPDAAALAASLYAEVEQTFPSSTAVHIGGDEWGGDVSANGRVAWMNAVAADLGDREVWAWNDGIDRAAIARLDPRIRVTYWSFDGDTEDPAERRERRQRRAKASDLYAAGTDLLNYDSYYLYEVPTDLDEADSAYTVADLRAKWSLRSWDGDSGARLAGPMSGAAVAVWGEDLAAPPSGALLRWTAPHVIAMIETANR
ncbi:family 20 glycosylhydrolase [Curtobacterium sp. DN_7.5]|uniref:family 20 glycosylhydrolase n=1 Tax=Curtobacterium sp. DN_7.5 TaxID=3049047 RepID=UPI001F5767A2|nr:family 20 glycosylhydrolase [Curtobacterium sp. DN_7.5]